MVQFNLFSNRTHFRNRNQQIGISLESLNGIQNFNNIMVSNLISSQNKYSKQNKPIMFRGSMVNYVNSPSASCGCGKN
jgi:hypothetical protein